MGRRKPGAEFAGDYFVGSGHAGELGTGLSQPVDDGTDDVVDEAEKQKHPEQEQIREGLVVAEGVAEKYGREKEASEDAGHGWSSFVDRDNKQADCNRNRLASIPAASPSQLAKQSYAASIFQRVILGKPIVDYWAQLHGQQT